MKRLVFAFMLLAGAASADQQAALTCPVNTVCSGDTFELTLHIGPGSAVNTYSCTVFWPLPNADLIEFKEQSPCFEGSQGSLLLESPCDSPTQNSMGWAEGAFGEDGVQEWHCDAAVLTFVAQQPAGDVYFDLDGEFGGAPTCAAPGEDILFFKPGEPVPTSASVGKHIKILDCSEKPKGAQTWGLIKSLYD